MYIDKLPENNEIRYWIFYDNQYFYFEKVRVLKTKYDKENQYYISYVQMLENYIDNSDNPNKHEDGSHFIVDFKWQLQETKEDAMRLAIETFFVMSENEHIWFWDIPPWEKSRWR